MNHYGDVLSSTFNDNGWAYPGYASWYTLLSDNGYVYAGGAITSSNIRRFNQNGEQLWSRDFFNSNGLDTTSSVLHGVTQLPDSSILAVGAVGIGGGVGDENQFWSLSFVCLDLDGNTVWIKQNDLGNNGFNPSGLFHHETEFVLVCGGLATYTVENGLNIQHSIKKLNYTCDTILQEYTWGGWCSEESPAMLKMANGNYMVAYEECYDNPFGYPNYPYYSDRKFKIHLMEFNPISMTPMWEGEYFSNAINDETWFSALKVTDIASTNDGGYLISFIQFANDGNYPGSSSSILKVNEDREQEWFKTFSYSNDGGDVSSLLSIEEAFDGGVISSGYVDLSGQSPSKQWVLKLDACGDVEYNGCDFVSALETSAELKKTLRVYPNPANEQCHLILPADVLNLRLRDLMGKLVLRKNVSNETEVDLDLSQLGSGIYVVECEDANGNLWSEKLVVE
jgi:hypothetical protein